MTSKVSIIIPAYNVENFIYRAIESSINQIYKNIEIIIVDDGSNDRTWDIICKYREKDKRIIAYKQINKGVSSARNKGLSLANGDYAIFIDSDDWISEYCIDHLVDALKKVKEYTLICCDCYYAFFNEDEIDIQNSQKNYISKNVFMNLEKSMICFCNSQYRLSSACYKIFDMRLIKKYDIHFEESISHGEDGLFVYNYLKHSNGMYYFTEPLWYILDRPGSATTSKYNKKWLSAINSAEYIFNDNDKKQLKKYFSFYCCSRISMVLRSVIRNYNVEYKKDVSFLKRKLRLYIYPSMLCKTNIKNNLLYILLAYFPVSLLRKIIS